MSKFYLTVLFGAFCGLLMGCGGSGSSAVSTAGPSGQSVTVTFTDGTPSTVETQAGTGAFAAGTVQGGKLTFNVPPGTTKFSIAYVCPPVSIFGVTQNFESVLQATTQDGTAFTVSCQGIASNTVVATGTVDASAIAGATDVRVFGINGVGTDVGGPTGTFDAAMRPGTKDVGFAALDNSSNVLAVKILRNQTLPGSVNGGNPIVFAESDVVTNQVLTINVPAAFVVPPAASVFFLTANGTAILLGSSATQYPAVPAAAVQTGDFYQYQVNSDDTATHKSSIGITQNTTSGGGAATLSLPTPWSFSGPAPAAFPTFTFNYTGFSGAANISELAQIGWSPTPNNFNIITITSTAAFQNGSTTLAIPNLSSLPGFFGPAPSGTAIDWAADIFAGAPPFAPMPANSTSSFVQNLGTYTQP